jgi:hypothetical protein
MKCACTALGAAAFAAVNMIVATAASVASAQSYVGGKPENSVILGGDSNGRSTPTLQLRAGSQYPGALRKGPSTRLQPRSTFRARSPVVQPSWRAVQSLRRTIQSQVQRSVRRATRTNRALERETVARGRRWRRSGDSEGFVRNPLLTPWQQQQMETQFVGADDIRDSQILEPRDIGGESDPTPPPAPRQTWSTRSSPDPFNPRRAIDRIDDELIKVLEQRELARERYENGGGFDHDLDAYRDSNDKIKALQDKRIDILRQYAKNPQALDRAEQNYQATRGLRDPRYRGVLDSRRPTESQRSDWLNDPSFRQ